RDNFTDLRDWVIAHTQNHYLPYGSGRYRPASLEDYQTQVAEHEERRRVRAEAAAADVAARRAAKKRQVEEQHQARLRQREARTTLITSLQSLSPAARLERIIADTS